MNLICLFDAWGKRVWVNARQLSNQNRRLLTLYTSRGNKVREVARTKSQRENSQIHRDNLFASFELANQAHMSLTGRALPT